jgi:hypothetical protein
LSLNNSNRDKKNDCERGKKKESCLGEHAERPGRVSQIYSMMQIQKRNSWRRGRRKMSRMPVRR